MNQHLRRAWCHRSWSGAVCGLALIGCVSGSLLGSASGEEIGYIEEFALAADRTVPLQQLIPGTEDYYYYHCLHHQNLEQYQEVERLLADWIERHKYTPRVREILNRQALLRYGESPEKSLAYLRQQLQLQFNHQRQRLDAKPNLPTELDAQLIARPTLLERALSRHQNTQGVEDSGLDWLVEVPLDPDRRRHLLERLRRPDYPGLTALVLADLTHANSRGFGSLPIHGLLLKDQLDQLVGKQGELLNQSKFVSLYLPKLHPTPDEDWQHDPGAYRAFLERLWSFVQRLAPVHNSLKAHVLYHRLDFDRSQGDYDAERFLQYLQLPRQVAYIEAEFLRRGDNQRHAADLSSDFRSVTLLPPVRDDEPLVRSYLQHFFVEAANYDAYADYIRDDYLKQQFAETKVVHGLGDPQRWYAMLTPGQYQALKDRIDLEFAVENPERFSAADAVGLDLYVKNVETLIVKVYEINTLNFYRENLREVNTDIGLDGLVANWEQTERYAEPPLRRVRRHYAFPQLNKPGVYVVEFIGNGKSSRAVIRKGRLRHTVRTTAAGQAFRVLDEQNRPLDDATIWYAGSEYRASEQGEILIPFSNAPQRQKIILRHGDFCSLAEFPHESENYTLTAGIYVDRESLLQRSQAEVLIRSQLALNGTPVPLSLLEDVRLVITSTDHDGVSSTKEIGDLTLEAGREAVASFQVPLRLASLQFELSAKVQNLSQDKKIDVAVRETYAVNEIDRTDKVQDLHLVHAEGAYLLELLGRTGEPQADQAVNVVLKHRDFRDPVNASLQTDADGRVRLGALPGIATVQATGPQGTAHTWTLLQDRHTHYGSRHGIAGQPLVVPYAGAAARALRSEFSLLSIHGNTFVEDCFEALSIDGGLLRIAGLEAGDYDLWLKRTDAHIRLRLTPGERRFGRVLGPHRMLEVRGADPLQIRGVTVAEEGVQVVLQNAHPEARLHVFATRYHPAWSAYGQLSAVRDAEPAWDAWPPLDSLYASGRNLGDEYRYIIERKYAAKYPGNQLERPSLLLNPWAIRSTETDTRQAAAGDDFAPAAEAAGAAGGRGEAKGKAAERGGDFANLDFLRSASAVLLNLRPDAEGRVTIPRDPLGPHQHLHFLAVDARDTVYREVLLPASPLDARDLRLAQSLDPDGHYAQKKQISVVTPERPLVIEDIASSRLETYDTLGKVLSLYTTLNGDSRLAEFRFVADWPELPAEARQEKYSKYACHELNLFLRFKDPAFFERVVLPYVKNKKEKQFLDHWLLGDDLRPYLQPWSYGRLNIVERILLSQRIAADRELTRQHVRELWDVIPPDVERFHFLFQTALRGAALETDDALGIEQAKQAVEKKARDLSEEQLARGLANRRGGAVAASAAPPAPARPMSRAESADRARLAEIEAEVPSLELRDASIDARLKTDLARDSLVEARKSVRQLYRKLDKTQEWVENHYYHLPIEQQTAELITVNAFWRDYAAHDPGGDQAFRSVNLAEASRSFHEIMLALAVLDLPFRAEPHESAFEAARMRLQAGSPMIVYHEEIKQAEPMPEATPILVSENFFRQDDRYRYVDNERRDKFVTDEFLSGAVYGCQVVITNPTSSAQKLEVLLQVPQGAIPVLNGRFTRSVPLALEPFHTQTLEYHFYFPIAGQFPHYPVHVAKNEQLLAQAMPCTLNVVDRLTRLDTESWEYVSQHGEDEDVLRFLREQNLQRIALDKIAFRMQDAAFFDAAIPLLSRRHAYDQTLWSYGIKHDRPAAIRQYLMHAGDFLNQCGSWLDSPLVTIDPVERQAYEHMDYRPLVNARAHRLGPQRQILNDRFHAQYQRLLKILSYRRELDDAERMSVVYYLLLQDRVEEALAMFAPVRPERLATRLQYDYFQAYLQFYEDDPTPARAIAERYAEYPVDRWREAFAAVRSQLDEIEGGAPEVIDPESRSQKQTELAASESSFDFQVEARTVAVNYQNLESLDVRYYLMDIELLFSRNPFVQQYSGQFSNIRPNSRETVALPGGQSRHTFPLPESLHNRNVLVEIQGGGRVHAQAYYSNALDLQVIEGYGQVRVAHQETRKPLAKVYVKAYAQMQDGSVQFYKDGYTDHRGRFDYTSLSTNELDAVQRFSLLILSDEYGAVVREAQPPKR